MKKSNLLISASAAMVALIAVTGMAMYSFAAGNEETAANDRQRPENFEKPELPATARAQGGWQKMEKMLSALEAGDYETWAAALPENCPMKEKINKDNFSRLLEAETLMKEADAIMAELGVNGFGRGRDKGMRPGGGECRGNCQAPQNIE